MSKTGKEGKYSKIFIILSDIMSLKLLLSCKSVNPLQCYDLKDIVYATFNTRNYMK